MKQIVSSSILVASLLAAGAASAETLTPTADTYVLLDNHNGYGTSTSLSVDQRSGGDGGATRKAVIAFPNPSRDLVREATLALDVVGADNLSTATFLVWGVREGSGCAETFDEGSAGWNTFPYFDTSSDGVDNGSSCLYDGSSTVDEVQALGSFTVQASDVGHTVTFSSQALLDFINTDTNGTVTFAITCATNQKDLGMAFGSRENTSHQPRLEVERLGQLNINDPDAFQGTSTMENGTVHFEGDLQIPVGGSKSVVVPGASVDMTFDADGDLQTISGTVGFPTFSGIGLLGELASSAPSLTIGYGCPQALVDAEVPVDCGSRYFYFEEQSGASVSWGPLSMSSPVGGSTMFALAPNEPTVYFYSDQLFPDSPISSVAIGVSGANAIPFQPSHTDFVESHMVGFDGDLYLGGAIGLEIPKKDPTATATITGDMTVDVRDADFVTGNTADWIQKLGANAKKVELSADVGPFSLAYDVGGASVLYHRGGTPSLTFAGEVDDTNFAGNLPLFPDGSVRASGFLSGDASQSYVVLDGNVKFGPSFAQQKFDLTITLDSSGGTIDGKAKFAGTSFDVQGSISNSRAQLSGSISHKFNAYAGSIETTIRASFDTNHDTVDLDADAKLCISDGLGDKTCTKGGADVQVNSDGKIRICATIPGYGTTCDTLD